MTVINRAVLSENVLEELKSERRIPQRNKQETKEEVKVLPLGPLCGYIVVFYELAAAFDVLIYGLEKTRAEGKRCCRSDNMSLPQTSPPPRLSGYSWGHPPSWVLVDWRLQHRDSCMAEYIAHRTEVAPPFTTVGFDVLGPGRYVLGRHTEVQPNLNTGVCYSLALVTGRSTLRYWSPWTLVRSSVP